MKILVLRGGAIGDFIVCLPAIAKLRARWPEAHIELVGYPHVASLAVAAGLVDKVTSLEKASVARLFSLRPSIPPEQAEELRGYDLVVSYLYDPAETVKANLLELGVKNVVYGDPRRTGCHAVDVFLKPLESLAIFAEGNEIPVLTLKAEHVTKGREWAERVGERVVAIHPGSGSLKKNWPLANFLAVGDALAKRGFSPLVSFGEADHEIASTLAARQHGFKVMTGLSLLELAGLLSCCKGYVGNDSGITHLAAAVGIPAITLFGPTDPAVWAPRGPHVHVLRATHSADMATISVDEVVSATEPW